jgi:hypothetical protein
LPQLGLLVKLSDPSINFNLDVIDNETLDLESRRNSANSLTQAAGVYAKIIDLYEKERAIEELERIASQVSGTGNGHRS